MEPPPPRVPPSHPSHSSGRLGPGRVFFSRRLVDVHFLDGFKKFKKLNRGDVADAEVIAATLGFDSR